MTTATVPTWTDTRKARVRAEMVGLAYEQAAKTGEVSQRGITAAMGMSPANVYRYFTQGELSDAVAGRVYAEALAAVDGTDGWTGYRTWADKNPTLFRFLASCPDAWSDLHREVSVRLYSQALSA